MTQLSLGDLAGNFLLRRQNVALKQSMSRLTNEVTSGRAQDSVSHLSGRLSALASFERDLELIEAYRTSASEARVHAASMQAALGQVQDRGADLAETITMASTLPNSVARASLAASGRQTLEDALSALNTQAAGRYVFSGTQTSTPPLGTTETLLSEAGASLSGLTTAQDVLAAADAFFDPETGSFDALLYKGGKTDLAPISLGEGRTVTFDIRADDPALKSALKTAVLSALIEDIAPALAPEEITELFSAMSGRAAADQDGLVRLQADLGFAEQRIEARSVEISSWKSATQLARNDLLSVDSYEAATELEAVQQQLETLYSLTARSSRLSLVNFLS